MKVTEGVYRIEGGGCRELRGEGELKNKRKELGRDRLTDRLSCCSPAVGAHVDELNAIRPCANSPCAHWFFFQEAPMHVNSIHIGTLVMGLYLNTRATILVAGLTWLDN
jgi:hypothetical protein